MLRSVSKKDFKTVVAIYIVDVPELVLAHGKHVRMLLPAY